MSRTGETLGGDLALIYQTGAQLLPHLADQFEQAEGVIGPISDEQWAWERHADFGQGSFGSHPQFNAYCDAIIAHLKTTAANLDDTGRALCYAATDYARTDAAAQAEFDKHKNDVVL